MSDRETTLARATEFWNREVVAPTHHNWLAQPRIREYVNTLIGGETSSWPFNWFVQTYPARFPRALSIGCGTGALERDLLRRGISEQVDAFDASDESLRIAREAAAEAGMAEQIRYYNADFENVTLPRNTYDMVVFHQSLHHVSRMERLLRQVIRSLRPDGLLYVDEYVGPSRTYWNAATIGWHDALYQTLPREIRWWDTFPLPVQWDDLSEAVRSGEILSRLRIGFTIEHERGYGGNILAVLYPGLVPGQVSEQVEASLINAEQRLLSSGAPHYYAVVTARPKRGIRGAAAAVQYFLSPKLRRIQRELIGLIGGDRTQVPEERSRFRR
jgi:SAM-dependent methyltransferase